MSERLAEQLLPRPVKLALVLAASGLLFGACSSAHLTTPQVPEVVGAGDNTVGPGDVFEVRVYEEKDLTGAFRVASDGTIDYPLIDSIQVDGKTPFEITELIERLLKEGDFLKNPQVSVLVKEYNSKKVSVFGQVSKPGTFPYQDGMTVVEAISLAGGFNSMARKNDTTVTRTISGAKRNFKVPVEAIGQGRATNFILHPGDIVFVPERVF